MSKKLIAFGASAILALTLVAPVAYAQTSTTTSSATQIQNLMAEVVRLQALLKSLDGQRAATSQEIVANLRLARQLSIGMSGEDVTALQQLLAEDPTVYPEGLVTGYFGALTERAVRRYQEKNGIAQVGRVGPLTLSSLNQKLGTRGLPPGQAKKLDGTVFNLSSTTNGSTTVPTTGSIVICHYPPGNRAKAHTMTVGAPSWKAHQAHGDTYGACGTSGGNGGTPTTTPDTTAPSITSVGTSNVASTTLTVSWTTNENADSKIWYSTTSPVSTSGTANASSGTLTTSHTLNLTGLTASSTYYYVVGSTDGAGNTATSSQNTVTTSN